MPSVSSEDVPSVSSEDVPSVKRVVRRRALGQKGGQKTCPRSKGCSGGHNQPGVSGMIF